MTPLFWPLFLLASVGFCVLPLLLRYSKSFVDFTRYSTLIDSMGHTGVQDPRTGHSASSDLKHVQFIRCCQRLNYYKVLLVLLKAIVQIAYYKCLLDF